MQHSSLVVLADPTEPQLAMLDGLPDTVSLAAGDRLEAFERLAPQADVIFSWSRAGQLLRDVFRMTPRVRWIHSRSAGLEDVLFPDLASSRVIVTNGSGVFSESLGEWVLAAALFFAKDLARLVRSRAAGRWDPFDPLEIAGQTMTIVGYGDIGRAVARRARCMGMNVVGVRRRPERVRPDDPAQSVVGLDRLPEAMAAADYVVASAPLTIETRGLIGARELAAMKPSAIIMNVGRGPVIDEAALVEALHTGRIRGAALDVFDREPLPAGHPFWSMENVLLSPHSADHVAGWLEGAMRFFLEQFERYRNGEPLKNVVDKQTGY